MTEKLYDNGLLMEFDALVTGCTEVKGGYGITLDRSAFFPEGGGQAGDVGMLGGVRVLDTYERCGEVIHLCDVPLSCGTEVHGAVDCDIRLRRMQNHSGEHLLMGFIHQQYGYENVGFHLGSSYVTLDLDGVLPEEGIYACEQAANEAIARDVPITVSYPESSLLPTLSYRSKLDITENVRLVTIEGIDVCACCAPHLSSTGMIGMIKVLSAENYKGGTRLHILSGLDALGVFRERMESVHEISKLLSAKPELTAEAVGRLLAENLELKRQIAETEKQRTEELIASLKNDDRRSFCVFTSGVGADAMRRAANEAVLLTDGAAGVFCRHGEGYSYIIASEHIPLRERAKEINTKLSGKGGGSDRMIQGTVSADRQTIELLFAELE